VHAYPDDDIDKLLYQLYGDELHIYSFPTRRSSDLSEMKKEFPNYKYEKYIEKLDDTGYMEDVEVQVTYGPDVTAERLDKMPALKCIHVMQSGLNSIPFNELIKRGIILTSSKGINSVTIAEYTIGMMLNIIRNSFVYYDAQKRNEWDVNTN